MTKFKAKKLSYETPEISPMGSFEALTQGGSWGGRGGRGGRGGSHNHGNGCGHPPVFS